MPFTFRLPIFRSYGRAWALCNGSLALAVCPMLAAQTTAAPQIGRLIAQRASASVVLLTMSDTNGQPISLGSGFFVAGDVIATNLHVISGASQGRLKRVGQPGSYSIAGSVGVDEEHDLVLLKAAGIKLPALALGDSETVAVGDEVYVVGNPLGLEGTLSNGVVSAIREIDGQKILQITAPISPGSSGGPVFDQRGEVIGIAVATLRGGQNLNFAVPVSYLSRLLLRAGSPSPISSRLKPANSVIDALGGRLTEGIQITQRRIVCFPFYHVEFSIRNTLPQAVDDVSLVFVFKDLTGEVVDSEIRTYSFLILPGLAKRPLQAEEFPGIPGDLTKQHLSGADFSKCLFSSFSPEPDPSFIEIRVLGFRLLDEH